MDYGQPQARQVDEKETLAILDQIQAGSCGSAMFFCRSEDATMTDTTGIFYADPDPTGQSKLGAKYVIDLFLIHVVPVPVPLHFMQI